MTNRAEGYLGWKTVNDLERGFWDTAQKCESSKTPVNPAVVELRSEHGFHIIMVHDRK